MLELFSFPIRKELLSLTDARLWDGLAAVLVSIVLAALPRALLTLFHHTPQEVPAQFTPGGLVVRVGLELVLNAGDGAVLLSGTVADLLVDVLLLLLLALLGGLDVGGDGEVSRAAATALAASGGAAGEPGVVEGLLGGHAGGRVPDEEATNKVLRGLGDAVPVLRREVVLRDHDLLEKLLDVLRVKGREAGQEDVRDDADAPHVHLTAVEVVRQDLRGDVARGATGGLHAYGGVEHLGEAKVRKLELQGPLALEKDVLGLDVAVDDAHVVQIGDGTDDLLGDINGNVLRIRALVDNVLKEFAALR
mmetsp:Transcript_17041/g.47972  ORF Transcript_17041/g.47972 Transcript_17041/m.47972 type:complete len:306 (-) Transcript_17041:948-1865(-)